VQKEKRSEAFLNFKYRWNLCQGNEVWGLRTSSR